MTPSIKKPVLVLIFAAVGFAFSPDSVKQVMQPLSLDKPLNYPVVVEEYFRYYRLDTISHQHFFGYYLSGTFTISAHVFMRENPVGTVLVVHGYYDHSGIVHTIIQRCFNAGYAVVSIDLPGHGLSSGTRSSIDDFSYYGHAIGDFLKLYAHALPRPLILAGHSTGCSAIIEYLHLYGEKEPSRIILCAPLVRSAYWGLSRFTYLLGKGWLTRTKRWFRTESSDTAWLKWYRHEPLQESTFPLRWARSVFAWNNRLPGYSPLLLPVMVIQGDKDDTVDWRYNLPFLAGMCTHMTVHTIKNGHHQLANEGRSVRKEFLDVFEMSLTQ